MVIVYAKEREEESVWERQRARDKETKRERETLPFLILYKKA